MSEPKRYAWKVNEENDFDLIEHSNGEFVRYEDYARLKAEVENSKRINTELLALSNRQASDIRRLTKAGDAMASIIKYEPGVNTFDPVPDVVKRWNAAKKGGQP